jgi:hypothetical protein
MGYRSVVGFTVASLGLACGGSTKTCTPDGVTAATGDGGDCCSGYLYATKCASNDCWTAGQPSNGSGSLSGTIDPTGGNCCAGNGASSVLSPTQGQSPDEVPSYYCNPVPNCITGGTVPTSNDEAYCCSATTYDGVCTPTYPYTSGAGPNPCVLSWRVTDPPDAGPGVDCCAAAGTYDAGNDVFYCNPRTSCTSAGSQSIDPGSSDCCSGEATSSGLCCALTGQPGSPASGPVTCCADNGVDGNGNCNLPGSCTPSNQPSVSPGSGSDCCSGQASQYTGLCAETAPL